MSECPSTDRVTVSWETDGSVPRAKGRAQHGVPCARKLRRVAPVSQGMCERVHLHLAYKHLRERPRLRRLRSGDVQRDLPSAFLQK